MSFIEMLPYAAIIAVLILLSISVYRSVTLKKRVSSAHKYTQLSDARIMLVMMLNRLIHDDGEITEAYLDKFCKAVKEYCPTVDFKVEVVAETFQCRLSIGKYFVTVDGYLKPPHDGKPYFIK